MTEVSQKNFGLLIAYLLPGVLVVVALADHSTAVRSWLGASPADSPTVGGFLFLTVAAVMAGMTVSAIRWIVLDFIHHRTGLRPPVWDFSVLQANLTAFEGAVENHYRHYQFYGNMLIALLLMVAIDPRILLRFGFSAATSAIGFLLVLILFFTTSRDTLRKYYARASVILSLPHSPKETRHGKRLA